MAHVYTYINAHSYTRNAAVASGRGIIAPHGRYAGHRRASQVSRLYVACTAVLHALWHILILLISAGLLGLVPARLHSFTRVIKGLELFGLAGVIRVIRFVSASSHSPACVMHWASVLVYFHSLQFCLSFLTVVCLCLYSVLADVIISAWLLHGF
jgi:hypothetical protein